MLEEIRNTEFSIWECCITAQSFQSSLKYLQYITPVSIHLQCRKSLLHQSYHFQSCSNWFIHPEKPGKQTHKLPAIQLAELFFIRSLNELVEPLVRGMTARPMKQEKKPITSISVTEVVCTVDRLPVDCFNQYLHRQEAKELAKLNI